MAKPSKRRKAVEKRQNRVLIRQRQQERRKAKAAKVADRLMGRHRIHEHRWVRSNNTWRCQDCNVKL